MICCLCVYILLRSWNSVCIIHFLKKESSCRSLFYAPWTGNYFGKTSSVYCICISGHQKCLRFNLPPWLECFFTGLSLSLCFPPRRWEYFHAALSFLQKSLFPCYGVVWHHKISLIYSFIYSFAPKLLWVFHVQSQRDLQKAQNVESVHSHGFG